MPSVRRFTRLEDEMIVRQSRGEFDLHELRKRIRANASTIFRRAAQLGVQVNTKRVGPPKRKGPQAHIYDDLTPARIKNDRLLQQLLEVHPERRYGVQII